jgi:hypothetical protein
MGYLLPEPAKKSREKCLKNQEDAPTGSVSNCHAGRTDAHNATQKTPPHRCGGGVIDKSAGWSTDRRYFLERLEAFNGLIFCAASAMLVLTWVARLQLPFFHLVVGSGQAAQYQPEAISRVRLHPLHCSTIS